MRIYVEVPEGKTLYQVLREKGLLKSAYCGGRGICGKCTVKVEGKEELACLLWGPFKGHVEVKDGEFLTTGERLGDIPVDSKKSGFGVALDLGTTGVEAALFDLSSGKFLGSLKTVNFQCSFGADVVTRIELARENYSEERKLLIKTVSFLISQFNVPVSEVVVVSNPVMHHFLLGAPVSCFERFPFRLEVTEEVYTTGRELEIEGLEEATVYLPPPLKNFVGSDFLANLLFLTELHDDFAVSDLGTNAEMGIWKNGKALATSVPAGPAFEGVGLFSGMRAVEGAVYKVFFDGREIRFLTIGNVKPQGLCATGYIDLITLLKSFGIVSSQGSIVKDKVPPLFKRRIREIEGELSFVLYEDSETLIALTQSDVRKFLLAKGAVFAALKVLSGKIGNPREYFLSGAFGTHVNKRSIRALKLIPNSFPEPKALGNLALKGASLLLGSLKMRNKINEIKEKTEVVELATSKEFERAYLEGLEI